jgi:hypothetical protein
VNRCPVCGQGPLPEALWQLYDEHSTCQPPSGPTYMDGAEPAWPDRARVTAKVVRALDFIQSIAGTFAG